ncbi:MAG TPA: hypothetical protein PLN24_04330, partial [Victivallales bacterium]|nr:hypothetical protein [Victivallales bacterium]
MIFLLSASFLFAIFANFANSVGNDFNDNHILAYKQAVVQFNDSFSAADEDAETTSVSEGSSAGRIFGIGFLFFISLISGVAIFILAIFLFFRWRKMSLLPKLFAAGCSLIFLIVFLLSLIGALIALYYSVKEKDSSGRKKFEDNGKHSTNLPGKHNGISVIDREPDKAELAKFAFSRFNNAVKLYQEYQNTHDPEIYKKAIEEIEVAIGTDDENPAYWLLAGKIYSEIAPDYDVQVLAEEYLRKSLELDPNNIQTLLSLANCLSLQERYYEANELFTKVLTRNYHAFRDYLVPIITYNYIYDKQYEKAERFLRNLLEND